MSAGAVLSQAAIERARKIASGLERAQLRGKVVRVSGSLLEFELPRARIGDTVRVERDGGETVAEIVGFRAGLAMALPFAETTGIRIGSKVTPDGAASCIPVGKALLGRTLDAFGMPLDGRPAPEADDNYPLVKPAPPPSSRGPVSDPFHTGVRVVDTLLTLGRGQRVGLFAGAGVGKTTLVQQIARQSKCDVKVIALIGERGIEAHDVLTGFDMSTSVLVASTSDRAPLERVRGALAATAIAEYFRDQGADVLLIVDSLTRYAMALREVGLMAGELPATKGYPASAFAALPRLLERVAPMSGGGSITGLYTVLVEGDDLSDPVADSARSLLDGHVVLSRDLAMRGHFPAIDLLGSCSRVMHKVTTPREAEIARRARQLVADRAEIVEMRRLGVGAPGQDAEADALVTRGEYFDAWARQDVDEDADTLPARAKLEAILSAGVAKRENHVA